MLGPGRYLLGVVEILLLGGFAWLGGATVRAWLLPRFEGAPAHLATGVIALALLIWPAELLGSFGWLDPLPYLLSVGIIGVGLRTLLPRVAPEGVPPRGSFSYRRGGGSPAATGPAGHSARVPTVIALVAAAIAVIHFAAGVKTRLSTGMTGFDSTWYHGPFAAGFFQSGDTWDLHFIAPQFLAWFYPANGEIFHAAGMLAFGRDLLSPLLNLGWFLGCLVACWCIGRPYRVAPWSLVLGAIALSVPALADQAGEARNDIVGIFFLLAAVAVVLNVAPAGVAVGGTAPCSAGGGGSPAATGPAGRSAFVVGPYLAIGLAAGLAAGTKLNFLLPAAVLVVGLGVIAPRGARGRAFIATALAALAGGGYWYLRNLVHTGNPLPWIDHLGPISLPAPDQGLGGREAHSVLGYLTDGAVWSDWFLPGLHDGLWFLWPLLLLAAFASLVLCLTPVARGRVEKSDSLLRGDEKSSIERQNGPSAQVLGVAGLVGLATALAWLIAPTSASGPEDMPRGFESGLRYLVPALVLGLALLPMVPFLRERLASVGRGWPSFVAHGAAKGGHRGSLGFRRRMPRVLAVVALLVAIAIGYPVQRHYLESRYEDPSFTAPGLNAAFAWARDISDARIATTSTRQYPLFGTDLSNEVQFLGVEQPPGGFEAPSNCRTYRRLLNEGDYDYVIASRDREEAGKPSYPPQASWTEGPQAKVILRKPPTVVLQLSGGLDPSACP